MSEDRSPKNARGTVFGALGVVGVLALKFKFAILALIKGLTLFKFGWLLKSGLSMFITLWFYTSFWGLPYALAIIVVLLIHEFGHYVWMKAIGLDPQLPMFIPGLGAYTAMTKMPPDQAAHAWVAMAGPLIGGVFSAGMYLAGVHFEIGWLMAAGSTGFFFNLLQLIPAKPLDGGFIIRAISEWLLIPGTILLFAVAWMFQSILLLVIAGISTFSLIRTFMNQSKDPSLRAEPTEVKASMPQRLGIGLTYVSLTAMLGWLYYLSNDASISMMHR